ncbi:hypothetical protein P8C59_009027 [Phyllachora maydis]|uniref:U1-C C2H2-type zinc finger domain-containing protein n=1 Tax=Phyllachora maydis TaxID=1825666 RepID=A0AAD9MJ77_9PEZI|nr:hypothetical protein P8C59_009027 [Phyllachora maydis]
MSEYWKSTPRYWCKACATYVRDTPLERANHEATGRHQGSTKRQLAGLHRAHEQAERERARARREVARLDGVVGAGARRPPAAGPSDADRQRQLQELAGLGVRIPPELRGGLALVGDWTVTNVRVVGEPSVPEEGTAEGGGSGTKGVKRDRGKTEDEQDAEEEVEKAYENLRKKPKRWGREPARDEELDALLGGRVGQAKKEEEEGVGDDEVKQEEEDGEQQPVQGAADSAAIAGLFRKRKPKKAR